MALQDFQDEEEGAQRAPKLESKSRMPKVPDFSEKMVSPKRASPFVLDDFRGSNAYRRVNP